MKIFKTTILLISLVIYNIFFLNSTVKATVITKPITGYKSTDGQGIVEVNNDPTIGSKEIWEYTNNINDQQTRFSDYRTGGTVVSPHRWIYYGGTVTTTIIPPTIEYTDADGFSGTLSIDKVTGPWYGWDRLSIMGYNGMDPNDPTGLTTMEYTFYRKEQFNDGIHTNLWYNACTLEDIGVYGGTVSKTIAAPVAAITAPTTVSPGTPVFVLGSGTDPGGLDITNYTWTSSNGQPITGTSGNIIMGGSPVTLTLKVENSAGVWSDVATHVINITSAAPTDGQTVNVHYQSTGNDISPMQTVHPSPGSYSATALTIPGYNLTSASPQTITVGANNAYDIYFNYSSSASGTKAKLLQNFVDQDGKQVFTPYDNDESIGQEYIDNNRPLSGYELQGSNPRSVNMVAGQTTTITWVYNKIVPLPPYVNLTIDPSTVHQGKTATVTAMGGDPKNLPLTYTWTVSDGQIITGTGGTITAGSSPTSVTVYVTNSNGLKSAPSTVVLTPFNNPPTIFLNVPATVKIGDDIPFTAMILDVDGDTWKSVWTVPASMQGGPILDNGTTNISFNNIKDINETYTFSVTATDQFGLSATKEIKTTVLPVTPSATLNLTGTQKENRSQELTATDSGGASAKATVISRLFQFLDSNGTTLPVGNTVESTAIVKSLEPLTNQSLNFIIKKAGTYTAKYTVTNNFGISSTVSQAITVAEDFVPIAHFNISGYIYANKNDKDSQGHSLYTRILTDNSVSNDDTILHRIWFRCWDANNNYKYDDNFEVYSGGSWLPLGNFTKDGLSTWNEIAKLDISKIDDRNCTSITIKTPLTGNTCYYLLTQEAFAQPTIPGLISSADYKISDLSDLSSMPIVH